MGVLRIYAITRILSTNRCTCRKNQYTASRGGHLQRELKCYKILFNLQEHTLKYCFFEFFYAKTGVGVG